MPRTPGPLTIIALVPPLATSHSENKLARPVTKVIDERNDPDIPADPRTSARRARFARTRQDGATSRIRAGRRAGREPFSQK